MKEMKKALIRYLFFALCLTLLVTGLVCCSPVGDQASESSTVLEGDGQDVDVNGNGLPYRIVCRNAYSDAEMDAANSLRQQIGDATGIWMEITTDYEREGTEYARTDYEILIGDTNRDESVAVADNFEKNKDYGIYKPSTRIVIAAGSYDALQTAVNAFVERYVDGYSKSINIGDGETFEYRHEYKIGELKLDGKDIKDFVIVYANGDSANAKLLQGIISEKVGYDLKLCVNVPNAAKFIIRLKDDTANNASFECRWKCSDGGLEFSAGKYTNVKSAIMDFENKYLNTSAKMISIERNASGSVSDENEKMFIATNNYLATLEANANAKKQAIFNSTPDLSKVTGTKYYVSPNGNDANDGKSSASAWATLDKVNGYNFSSGDAVLFECGGSWRGRLTGRSGVTYASYGTGNKPMIIGASRNSADASLWENTDVENVYKYTPMVTNPGNIAFIDGNGSVTMSTRLHRLQRLSSGAAVSVIADTYQDLTEDLQFWFDYYNDEILQYKTGTLYLYSANGNPGDRFADIEIGEANGNVVSWANGATYDGLEVRYNGAHGFGGNADNVTVRNCVIQYIGGSLLTDRVTVYGNAIEVYGECDGFVAENNYINEIWDTGITFQNGAQSAGNCEYKNIVIKDNLIERCHWSIEFYNQKREGTVRSVKNVLVSGNFCRYSGQGWASKFRTAENGYELNETRANHICSWGFAEKVEDFVISDNIFESCGGFVLRFSSDSYGPGDKKIQVKGNTYIIDEQTKLAKVGSAYQSIVDFSRDTDATIAIIE